MIIRIRVFEKRYKPLINLIVRLEKYKRIYLRVMDSSIFIVIA